MNRNKKYNTIISILSIGIMYLLICSIHSMSYTGKDKCVKLSARLEDFFESLGINTLLKAGTSAQHDRHMWISVMGIDLDSITLLPFTNSHYNIRKITYEDYSNYSKIHRRS